MTLVLLALSVLRAPEQSPAQETVLRDDLSVVAADSASDSSFPRHALMSAVGSGAGVGAGFALARLTDDGAGGSVAPVTFGLVGSILGSAAAMALSDPRISLDPALGASAVAALGGIAATLMVEAEDGAEREGIVLVFSVGQGVVTATVANGLGY